MKTKKEILKLRKEWLDKCNEYNQKINELSKLSKQKNGNVDDELINSGNELHQLGCEVKQALQVFYSSCNENFKETMKNETDEVLKSILSSKFSQKTKDTNDWSSIMDELKLW